jgi:hypothetical protein
MVKHRKLLASIYKRERDCKKRARYHSHGNWGGKIDFKGGFLPAKTGRRWI